MSKKKYFNSTQERIDYEIEYKRKASERDRKAREKNPEEYNRKSAERFKKWKEKHPEKYQESILRYQENNREKILERGKKWQKENREKAYKTSLDYRNRDREHVNQLGKESRERTKVERLGRRRIRAKERKQIDPLYKMSEAIRVSISSSFKRKNKYKKPKKTEEILGCSIKFFIDYLLNLYPEKNLKYTDFHRYGYHIDHIIPLDSAKSAEEIIKLCHYTNFQPLWWRENLSKSNKILN